MVLHGNLPRQPSTAFLAEYYWLVLLLALVLLAVLAARLWWTARACRPGRRYEYRALREEGSESVELERRCQPSLTCQRLLRDSPRYLLLSPLPEMGSRIEKQWYLVLDTTVRAQRLVSLVPQSKRLLLPPSPALKRTLLEIFLTLQHPYVLPVLDLEFREMSEKSYVLTMQPPGSAGSLKDLIYQSQWQDAWDNKYTHGKGLEVSQVQRLGRQILEALLFLYARGFPAFAHLHSGNVIIQNGVARLTGFENALLEYTSRIYPLVQKSVKEDRKAIDIICFGHVLFEMCSGYELNVAHPNCTHLLDIRRYPQVTPIMHFIFEHPEHRYPSVEEIVALPFFRNLDLRELRSIPRTKIHRAQISPNILGLLKQVQRHRYAKRRSKSASAVEVGGESEGYGFLKSSDASESSPCSEQEPRPDLAASSTTSLSWSEPSASASSSNSPLSRSEEQLVASGPFSPSPKAVPHLANEHRPLRRQLSCSESSGTAASVLSSIGTPAKFPSTSSSSSLLEALSSSSPLHCRAKDCLNSASTLASPLPSCWRNLPLVDIGISLVAAEVAQGQETTST